MEHEYDVTYELIYSWFYRYSISCVSSGNGWKSSFYDDLYGTCERQLCV